jgi:chromosome segregation and condensation protein ScpB
LKFTDRYVHNGEMEDNCIMLLSYVEKEGVTRTTIRKLASKCKVPKSSLYDILRDAYEDKTHSTLFIYAMKYGYDFYIYNTWNDSLNQLSPSYIIDVRKFNWNDYKYAHD